MMGRCGCGWGKGRRGIMINDLNGLECIRV